MKLTPRHLDCLRLAAEGHTYPEIAAQLHISTGTVRSHISHILVALDARSTTHAVHIAHRDGILEGGTVEHADAAAVARLAFTMGYRIALVPAGTGRPA